MVRERDLSDECRPLLSVEWQARGAARRGSGVRMFRSRFFEAFTRTPPFVPYVVVSPMIAALLVLGTPRVSAVALLALVFAGALAWTLVEYLMHRFLFHFRAASTRGRVLSFLVHGHHHLHPDDPDRIVATPLQFGSLALLAGGLARVALGPASWMPALAGFLIGYLAYEAIHWRAHHGTPRTALGRALRRHHLRHHHEDARARWGISSPLWDWVLRTLLVVACLAGCGDDAVSSFDAGRLDARDVSDASDVGRDSGATDGSPDVDASATTDARATPDAATALGDRAPVFDGTSGYVEIPDDDAFSQPTYGELTVEAWLRPDSLSMTEREGSGYVHWIGKGESGEHEWVGRMYQEGNSEDRANRISFYSFNLTGGLGAGSYFQDDITVGEWIHWVGSFDDARTYIFRDGVQRDSDLLSGYDIVPMNGEAPVRIGTRDRNSFFEGAIARVAIYGTRLAEAQVAAHTAAREDGTYDATVLAEPSLVAYWPLDETSGAVARDVVGGRDGTYVGGVALGAAAW